MSTTEVVIIVLCSFAGSVVHGSVGIGLTLVAGPALIAIDPSFAPGPLLLVGQLVGARNAYTEREHVDRSLCWRCAKGLPVGLLAGIVVLEMLSQRTMAILVGSLTALAAVALLAGMRVERNHRTESIGGALVAFSSITAGLPGPPFVVVFSDLKPAAFRGTAGAYILMVASTAFVILLATGNFGSHELRLLLWLLPGIIVGMVASKAVQPYLDRSWFRPLVLVIALVGGLALVARQIL